MAGVFRDDGWRFSGNVGRGRGGSAARREVAPPGKGLILEEEKGITPQYFLNRAARGGASF